MGAWLADGSAYVRRWGNAGTLLDSERFGFSLSSLDACRSMGETDILVSMSKGPPREVPTAIKEASKIILDMMKDQCFPQLAKLHLTNTELVRAFTLALNQFREPIKGGSVQGKKRFVQAKLHKRVEPLVNEANFAETITISNILARNLLQHTEEKK